MKVVHLNSYENNGGAGRAASRLVQALKAQGLDASLWVNYSFEVQASQQNFSRGLFPKFITAVQIILERIRTKTRIKPVKTPFSIPFFGKDISRHPVLREADIIHLHWINHAFLRPKDLAKLQKLNKPIVWTFHDSNAFTGGCHVRYACTHFEQACGNCPIVKQPSTHDLSHHIWKSKKQAYAGLELQVIAPSQWMAQSAKKSSLFAQSPIHIVPNTLNTEVFAPSDKVLAREKLGLPANDFLILSGFMPSANDKHKGADLLVDALGIFGQNNVAELVVFGNRAASDLPDFNLKTTFLGTITEEEKLALCYAAADVFVTPSIEDNLPNTVLESLACGTPVVAFTTGGIPDMVKHQQNGYLAKGTSPEGLANGLAWVKNHADKGALSKSARQTVLTTFSETVVAQQHIQLYQTIIHNRA
ncbi:MAG: glycosyltransferase family 4 protein [Sphingobacteriaceae bacterium]|nr:glycosyltransferase family 4 protein [Sphingobacteriaceae bacterium]